VQNIEVAKAQRNTNMAIMNTPAILSLFLVVVPTLIEAQGDYACVDNKQCATEYFQYIGSNSTCVPGELEFARQSCDGA
jgi:hypothetical protein